MVTATATPERQTCPHGHPWIAENIYVQPGNGWKICRVCKRERMRVGYRHEAATGYIDLSREPVPEREPVTVIYRLYTLPAHEAHLRGKAAVLAAIRWWYGIHWHLPTIVLVHPANVCQLERYPDVVVRVPGAGEPGIKSQISFGLR